MGDVRQWLASLGLGQYADAFTRNDVEWDVLSELDHAALKDIGMQSTGHRLRILKAVKSLDREASGYPPAQVEEVEPRPPGNTAPPSGAERRQLTVMFCDLVGSTSLAQRMDPEDYREVLAAYQSAARQGIGSYDGYIARYMGDGLLVYFGYPQAHEDDAERAVRAGLDIVDAVSELRPREDMKLQVRIGVATGVVVAGDIVGEGASEERAVLGETPNLAARLQGIAQPDTVVLSESTRHLVGGHFEIEALAPQSLKGITDAVSAYRAIAAKASSRFEAATSHGLTTMTGRESELALLQQRWERVQHGEGQTVLLSGEPGIGKSRITQELRAHLGSAAPHVLHYQCSPYHTASAFHPFIAELQRAVGFARDDSPDTRRTKLEALVEHSLPGVERVAPLLAALLSLPLDAYAPFAMAPQQQKAETIRALMGFLEHRAAQGPLVILFEDAHWIDPSSREVLDVLVERSYALPLLCIVTSRPEFVPAWTGFGHVSSLSLNRLGRHEASRLVESVTGGNTLPAGVLEQIVAKTDGVPLFVEELTKTVLESGLLTERGGRYILEGPVPSFAIPSTLHDALLARLDRLGSAKEVAQTGACIGREFGYELLAEVSSIQGEALDEALVQLVESGLVIRRGQHRERNYSFKHALMRDAAYGSLLKAHRRGVHERIAETLDKHFPDVAAEQPEILAHHYSEAGLNESAVGYWQRAGQRASERSAYLEAIAHLNQGLASLVNLPETPARLQQELDIQVALGPALMNVRGQADPEVARAYARARELCQQAGETPKLFPVLSGLWAFYLTRSELQTARELGQQLLRLAHGAKDSALLLQAHRMLGGTLYYLGEFVSAAEHLEAGATLYDPQQHRPMASLYGQDPGVVCLSNAAWTSWQLGFPDRAVEKSQESFALARELAHPFSLAYVLIWSATLHQHRRDPQALEEQVKAVMSLSTEQQYSLWVAWGTILDGWLIAERGQAEAGIARLREGLTAWRATGAEALQPYFLALLAEVHGKLGQAEKGLAVITEALALVEEHSERFCEAELYRLKGELLLCQSPDNQAEAGSCFQEAIRTAQYQGAKSWELRAATSLARLRLSEGRQAEARQCLSEIYHWFTEGRDTLDLVDAKAILGELDLRAAQSKTI